MNLSILISICEFWYINNICWFSWNKYT